jgi:hypothetical protein
MTGPTPGSTVVCRQCGTTNTAGDQFCGNCGTFLEWSSEPAESPAPAAMAPDADPSLASLLERRPADATATDATAAAPRPSPGLVRCPTCGTANEAGKTFCLRCGNKLAGATAATRLPLPPRSEPGAPGTGATLTSAVPRPTTTARRREPADEGRGISGWVVVAGAGIAVGAIAVVVALMLGSGQPPPPAAASSAPSASVSVSNAPSAGASSRPSHAVKTPKPKPSK